MITEAGGPVLFKRFTRNTAAAVEVIPAKAGWAIRLLGAVLANNDASADVVVTIQDNTGTPVVVCGPLRLPAGPPVVLPANGLGYGQCSLGKSLDILLDGTEVVAGSLTYQYVKA